jgi:mono/diheme cytochrome c family protein
MSNSSAHDAPEKSNPVIWTIGLLVIITILVAWFSRWFGSGVAEGRALGPIPKEAPKVGEPDHMALIAKRNQEVLDRGAIVYSQNCASCHGPNGDTNPLGTPIPPRNYHADKFKAPWGLGPYGMYKIVSEGLPGTGMMGMPTIKKEDRYAVVHFIRETWVKKDNPTQYQDDKADILATVPAPGGASEGPGIPPAQRPIPPEVRVHPLMAGIADQTAAKTKAARAWLALAQTGAGKELTRDFEELEKLGDTRELIELHLAAMDRNRDRFIGLLINGASGSFHPYFNLLGEKELGVLYERGAVAAAHSTGSGQAADKSSGVK